MKKTDEDIAIVQGIMLCDHIVREEGTRKLSLIGTFSNFTFENFPAISPKFYIVPYLTNLMGEEGKFDLTLRIEEYNSRHCVFSTQSQIGFRIESPRDAVIDLPVPVCQTAL